jgi:HAD superfamily hydrolase (TIGR01509 family)
MLQSEAIYDNEGCRLYLTTKLSKPLVLLIVFGGSVIIPVRLTHSTIEHLLKTVSNYQAIIFDLDGVLANTEPGIFRIHQDVLRLRYDRTMPAEEYHNLMGLDYYDTAVFLIRKYALLKAPQELADELQSSVIQGIGQVVVPIRGSQEFVLQLAQRGINLGIASNSPSDYVRSVVETLGLSAVFPAPVCRDHVKKGKPAADPYLEACQRVGADPRHCLAVEDSPVGLQAALAAGMECALVGSVSLPELPAKTHRFAHIADLQTALFNQG